ncbi:MAG: sulfotransferase [Pseudomonadota bacterium]
MSDYTPTQRILHKLALSSTTICEAQFDIECALEKPIATSEGQHVFVAGLARAGTTILIRSMYKSGVFGTLTYRDMPFVMAPNLWAKLHKRSTRKIKAKMRAHEDGILVDADSPEAFEEVFWRVHLHQDYLNDASVGLRPHDVPPDVVESFRKYVSLVLKKSKSTRYLSKNNNNILRLKGILDAFPEAQILVPFRNPDHHAHSLLRQHERFLSNKDAFTQRYMGWLGHYEFGPGHRHFAFPEVSLTDLEPDDREYWLAQWTGVYQHLLENYGNENRVRFVCYEDLCAKPRAWKALTNWLDMPLNSSSEFLEKPSDTTDLASTEASDLYYRMRELHPDRH